MKRKPRVCILSLFDLSIDGRTLRQIKSLNEDGYEVVIIYHMRSGIKYTLTNKDVKAVGIQVLSHRLPKKPIFHLIMYFEFCLRAIVAALQEKADIYQGNVLDGLIPAYVAALIMKARIVYDAREIYTDMRAVKLKSFWRRLEALLIKKVDTIFNVNQERARLQQQRYGLEKAPVVVMNCPEVWTPKDQKTNVLRHRLEGNGLGKKRVVLYQGAIMRGRYLDTLVKAMGYIHTDTVLVIMGPDIEYLKELKTLATEGGLTDKVIFLDPIPPADIIAFAAGADLGVLFYESTNLNNYYCAPTKLYEYLMAGLPILVNYLPHLETMVNEEKVGKLVDAESPRSVAQGIDEVLENSREKKAMSKRAYALARDRYNWANQRKNYLDTYQQLLEVS